MIIELKEGFEMGGGGGEWERDRKELIWRKKWGIW